MIKVSVATMVAAICGTKSSKAVLRPGNKTRTYIVHNSTDACVVITSSCDTILKFE